MSARVVGDLRRIAPTYLEGVKLLGTFIVPVDRYAYRIHAEHDRWPE